MLLISIRYELYFFLFLCFCITSLGLFCFHMERSKAIKSQYNYAIQLYKQKEIEKAKDLFESIYIRNPEYREVAIYYGKILYYKSEHSKSFEIFKTAYHSKPYQINYLYWAIKTGFWANEKEENLQILINNYLIYDRSNPEIFYINGVLEERSGRLDLALMNYEESISKLSNLIPAVSRLSVVYSKVGLVSKSNWYSEMESKLRYYSKRKWNSVVDSATKTQV